jgi:hypothetical protein
MTDSLASRCMRCSKPLNVNTQMVQPPRLSHTWEAGTSIPPFERYKHTRTQPRTWGSITPAAPPKALPGGWHHPCRQAPFPTHRGGQRTNRRIRHTSLMASHPRMGPWPHCTLPPLAAPQTFSSSPRALRQYVKRAQLGSARACLPHVSPSRGEHKPIELH